MAQYFDPSAAPTSAEDAKWALEKSGGAINSVEALLASRPPGLFETD